MTSYYLRNIKFKQDSKLHQYLSEESNLVTKDKTEYRNTIIYVELEKIIDQKSLFDSTNPQIIVADHKLEEVLDVSRLHRDQIKYFVDQHFEDNYSAIPSLAVANEELKELTELRRKHKQIALVNDFDIDGDYRVDSNFQLLIKTVTKVNPSQNVFKYREIADAVSAYIMRHKEKFFDLRNILIIRSDALFKKIFKVNYFSRSQVTSLIRRDLRYVRRSKRLRGMRI